MVWDAVCGQNTSTSCVPVSFPASLFFLSLGKTRKRINRQGAKTPRRTQQSSRLVFFAPWRFSPPGHPLDSGNHEAPPHQSRGRHLAAALPRLPRNVGSRRVCDGHGPKATGGRIHPDLVGTRGNPATTRHGDSAAAQRAGIPAVGLGSPASARHRRVAMEVDMPGIQGEVDVDCPRGGQCAASRSSVLDTDSHQRHPPRPLVLAAAGEATQPARL